MPSLCYGIGVFGVWPSRRTMFLMSPLILLRNDQQVKMDVTLGEPYEAFDDRLASTVVTTLPPGATFSTCDTAPDQPG